MESLLQKRGTFYVAEAWPVVVQWHREFLPDSPALTDSRVEIVQDPGPAGLHGFDGELHAVLIHADTAPIPELAPVQSTVSPARQSSVNTLLIPAPCGSASGARRRAPPSRDRGTGRPPASGAAAA